MTFFRDFLRISLLTFLLTCLGVSSLPAQKGKSTQSIRSFTGNSLQEIAFPLGGIGTGCVSLGGRGDLRDWEIFGKPDKGSGLAFSFFATAGV